MSDLILFSQQDPSIPRVSIKLKIALTAEQKTAARNAALGVGAALEVALSGHKLDINVASTTLEVEVANVVGAPRVCIVSKFPQVIGGESEYVIVSGSVQIQTAGLVQDDLKNLWPTAQESQFGKLDRLIVTSSGLQIETELQNANKDRRRFHLIEGMSVAPSVGISRLVWRQIAWRDADVPSDAKHQDPADRLKAVKEASLGVDDPSAGRLNRTSGASPVTHVGRFDERTGAEGAVFVQVRFKNDGGSPPEARERIAPGWALSIGGADWSPRSLVIKGEPALDKADFFYTDGMDAFDEPPTDTDEMSTSFQWSWKDDTTGDVSPKLTKLADEPRLVTTGEVPGAGANLPYLWQRAKLVVDLEPKTEPGVWLRYRLDPLPVRENAVSRQSDYDAGLSRSIRLDNLKRSDDTIEPWRLDLSLLPMSDMHQMVPRMWLELAPVGTANNGNTRSVTLTIRNARIEAAAPKIHALQTALNDPAALPNQADRFEGLHADTRILMANDRELPDVSGAPSHVLRAALKDKAITLSALNEAHDVLVAYVPGPVAGIDLVPRVGGNLTPAVSTDPTDPPPPDRVRNYESGLVAIHLKSNITLHPTDQSLGTVSVSANTDLILPAEEMVAALHPWSLVRVKKDGFKQHELQPLHHNALLEAFDWARSTPDRKDAEPGALPPLNDPYGADGTRDFRRDEVQYTMQQAVRDRFANATANPLPLDDDAVADVANWLPGVTFKADKDEITPQITRKKSESNALEFKWKNAPDLLKPKSPQSLKLTPSPREFKVEATSTFTSNAHGLSVDTPIQLFQTGTFPGGVSPNTKYFVVKKDTDTFQLSTTIGGEAVQVTKGEGEWQPIADDWMSAWMRWNADDEAGKPTVHVDFDGKNGARQAKSSDIPLLEQRTPITAFAAGWLAGRMWVVFAVDAAQGNPKLFAWEPLAGDTPKPLQFTTPLSAERIDHLAVDASADSFTLVIAQNSKFTVATYGVANGVSGQPSVATGNVTKLIVAIRLAAQRVFIATVDGFTVWRFDLGQNALSVTTQNIGSVSALDVRAKSDASTIFLAVSTLSPLQIRVYGWGPLNQGITGDPTQGPANIGQETPALQLAGGNLERITSVVIQPLSDSLNVYAVAETKDGGSSQVVAWPAFKLPKSDAIASISDSQSLPADLQLLRRSSIQPFSLQTDPVLNDDNDLGGSTPLSQWLALSSAPTDAGHATVTVIPVLKWKDVQSEDERPRFGTPTAAFGHEGGIVNTVLIPGRAGDGMASASEARFGTWLVTGGADGTVRVWDPESGLEKFRHTESSGNWLDAMGVSRKKSKGDAPSGFWVEAISVPNDKDSEREIVLMLSTIGGPFNLLQNSVSPLPETELRFLCQDLPLVKDTSTTGEIAWMPAPWIPSKDLTNRRFRHGIYGFCGNDNGSNDNGSVVPKLFGLPIEVVQITKLVLDSQFDSQFLSVTAGTPVTVKKIEFDAILSNPAEMTPDGKTVPVVDRDEKGITAAVVKVIVDADGKMSLHPDSKFDWRFPLTDQLPPNNQSVLPGRLARLVGKVSYTVGPLKLIPDAGNSRAEALGRLRRFDRVPELVIDPSANGMVRFREAQSDNNKLKLEQLGNPLPHPDGDSSSAPITATEIGTDPFGNSIALLGAQPAEDTKPGSLQLSDLHTGQRLVSYTDRLKTARLVVDYAIGGDANVQRLTAIGVAEDGTVRVRQLYEFTKDANDSTIKPKLIPEGFQDQARFLLPSHAEDVQVFDDAHGMRWMLTRCRDGSAWLTTTTDGDVLHNFSMPETAVTAIAFSPALPKVVNDLYDNWRAFFGSIDPNLVTQAGINTLRAILAIGGADGRVFVYAVDEKGSPKLLRSFATLVDPVRSLSLEFEHPDGINGVLPGIFLMSCDGKSSMHLTEILSGASPKVPHGGEKPATHGILLSDTVRLRGVVQTTDGVYAWSKEKTKEDKFTPAVIDDPLEGTQLLASASASTGGFLVASNSEWKLYDFFSHQAVRVESEANPSAPVIDITDALIHKDRYVVALGENGVLDIRKKKPSQQPWDKLVDAENNSPTRVDCAVIGRALIPIVACRELAGQPGSFHAVDLGAGEWTWPDALGPVDADAPIAVAGLGGVPHLAVARSGNVTVWNLATGRVVHRVGVTTSITQIELGEDNGQPWLLVESGTDTDPKWKLENLSGTAQVAANLFPGKARLFAFAEGLRAVSTAKVGTTLSLQVVDPATPQTPTHIAQTTIVDAEFNRFTLLDAVSGGNAIWVLLRHSSIAIPDSSNDASTWKLSVVTLTRSPANATVTELSASQGVDPIPRWGVFDLQEGTSAPTIWTTGGDLKKAVEWKINTLNVFEPTNTHFDLGTPAISKLNSLSLIRHDGRKRLVAVAEDGLAIWDLDEKKLLRTEKLSNPVARVSQVALAAVLAADSKAGCLRFWDQQSGRLRQRLFTGDKRLGKVSSPDQLIALNDLARPRVVVGGDNKSIVVDVASGMAVGFVDGKHSSLCATVAQNHLVLGGIDNSVIATPKAKLWRVKLGTESGLEAATPVEPTLPGLVGKLTIIALRQHELPASDSQEKRPLTLLAAASYKSFAIYNADTAGNVLASALDTSDTVLTTSGDILAIRLSSAIEEDCIIAAVSLNTTDSKGHVELYDLPLKLKDDQQTGRPFTFWSNSELPATVSTALAVALTEDGPRVIANTQALRVSQLLRIRAGMPPVYELRIKLLQESGAFLTGRITPSRRLDLEVALQDKAKTLGLPDDITKLDARAALIQGPYSCFLVDSIDRDNFRLAGLLVLWSDSRHSSDAMQGVLLLEDSRPTRPDDSTHEDFGATATLVIPDGDSGTKVKLRGPRTRIRVMPFNAQSVTIDSLVARETLSWYLKGKPNGTEIDTELHLSDLLYDTSKLDSESEQTAAVRAVFSETDKPQIQGDLVVKVKRSQDVQTGEAYTLMLEKTAYAALAAVEPAPTDFGTTRDDVVYPAVPGGSVGRAFDLVEPQFQDSESDSSFDATEKLRLVTVVLDGTELKLLSIKPPASLAYDLNTGAGVTQLLPLQPIDVPQIEHREAHGARIRARWPSSFEVVEVTAGDVAQTLDQKKLWLLAPLARTPRGVTALTLNLLVRPHGRALDWTRLLTECVLCIHRDGANLFGDAGGTTDSPSIRNVLTSTILRSSGATQSEITSLFDDVRVQTHALRAGLSGVLLVRTRDARGRTCFRFVNSPYHSLVPIAAKRIEPSTRVQDFKDEETDPRLIPPADVFRMTTHSSPRFYPTYCAHDRSALRGFERAMMLTNDDPSAKQLRAVRLAELPALRGAETPTRPPIAGNPMSGGSAFVPRSFELGYGIDKPGAAFHQIVQCVGTMNEDREVHSALPTTYLRREPQRFNPPPRAGIQIATASTSLKRKKKEGTLTAEVTWTETLSIVPLDANSLSEKLTIVPDNPATPVKYTLQEPSKCLRWFVRLGEQIDAVNSQLTLPLTAFDDERSVDAFDMFIVTRIKDLGEGVPDLPDGSSALLTVKPFLVAVNGDASVVVAKPANEFLKKVEPGADDNGYEVWQLLRKDDKPEGAPVLLEWLKGLTNQATQLKPTHLNWIWWKDEDITANSYKNLPQLTPVTLRPVAYQPQSPRLTAVLQGKTGTGVLSLSGATTLFDGPAASSKGVTVTLEATKTPRPFLKIDAVDSEIVKLSDPFSNDDPAQLHLVKVFDDGATLETHQEVTPKSS